MPRTKKDEDQDELDAAAEATAEQGRATPATETVPGGVYKVDGVLRNSDGAEVTKAGKVKNPPDE